MKPTSPRHLTIVTGASRGLGLALTALLLAQGQRVVAIARHPARLDTLPPEGDLLNWEADLGAAGPVADRLAQFLAAQDPALLASVSLINNAGMVSQPGPLSAGRSDDLAQALRVGLEAPMLLSAAFLRATAGWTLPRKLLLISSGLGRRAMAGSAAYCAAKAGMDHLARAVALEEAGQPHGARVVSLAPGIIDTDMQVQLRNADPVAFPERERFAGFKNQGQLDSPQAAAAKVLRYLARSDFGAEPVADVRDA